MSLDRERIATNEQGTKVVMYRRFDDRGGVEGFAETDNALVGVDLNPNVMRLLCDTDGFDLGDFHGVVLNFFLGRGLGVGMNVPVRVNRLLGRSVEIL